MRELGFGIERDGRAFKLSGIPQHICDYYSKRSKNIREAMKAVGRFSSASKVGDFISLVTRDKKRLVVYF